MKVNIEFSEFSPWSGAVDTWNKINDAGLIEQFEAELEAIYEDNINDTQLNDLLWFNSDWCLKLVGLGEEEDDDEEDDDFDNFCNSFDKCAKCPLDLCVNVYHCQQVFNKDKNKWTEYIQNN